MKHEHILRRFRYYFTLAGITSGAWLLAGCDTFDTDITDPEVKVSPAELYVLAEGETAIDLNSLVTANFSGRLSVTELPARGKLQRMADGLLRYTPNKGLRRSQDSFELTVFAQNNDVLKRDTIFINIETDSTLLPCNLYPRPDYVNDFEGTESVTIDVLKNDFLCGKSVTLQIYQPEPAALPHHGTATAEGTTVIYTPGPSFTGIDTLIYKLTHAQNPASVAYGFVYINSDSIGVNNPDTTCHFQAMPDSVDISALNTSLVYLNVLANDQVCDSLTTITITREPTNGTAFVDNGTRKIGYNRVIMKSDSLQYEICNGVRCSKATAYIKQQD